jgi:uncharacterized membrane protein
MLCQPGWAADIQTANRTDKSTAKKHIKNRAYPDYSRCWMCCVVVFVVVVIVIVVLIIVFIIVVIVNVVAIVMRICKPSTDFM